MRHRNYKKGTLHEKPTHKSTHICKPHPAKCGTKECAFWQPKKKFNFFHLPFGVLFFRHPQPPQKQADRHSENPYRQRLGNDGGQKASLWHIKNWAVTAVIKHYGSLQLCVCSTVSCSEMPGFSYPETVGTH